MPPRQPKSCVARRVSDHSSRRPWPWADSASPQPAMWVRRDYDRNHTRRASMFSRCDFRRESGQLTWCTEFNPSLQSVALGGGGGGGLV